MPFQISVNHSANDAPKFICIGLDLFCDISDIAKETVDSTLALRIFTDYYSDAEVYAIELESLRTWLIEINEDISKANQKDYSDFLKKLFPLIDYAISHRTSMRFEGD